MIEARACGCWAHSPSFARLCRVWIPVCAATIDEHLANAPQGMSYSSTAAHFCFRIGNRSPTAPEALAQRPLTGSAATRRASGETREPLATRARRPSGAPSLSCLRGLRRLDRDAHCRRTAPCRIGAPRDDVLCKQGALNINALARASDCRDTECHSITLHATRSLRYGRTARA